MTTVWVRIDPARTNAAALAANDAVPAVTPLIIRLHPNLETESVEDFHLPYNPIQVQYGDLGDEITQIPRPATTPIVAFKAHRLLTIDFNFIVAQPGDGLATSVDDKLQILRRFAASGHRVISLLNFDSLTNLPFAFRNASVEARTNGLFFNIVDMSISVVRRNKNNQISQAEVSLSLVENRNPRITIRQINALPLIKINPNCKDKKWAKRNPDKCPKKKDGSTAAIKPLTAQNDETAHSVIGTTLRRDNCIYKWISLNEQVLVGCE